METSAENTSSVRGRRVRTLWTVGIGTIAAASLAGAIFAGVANADETPTGSDRATQEQSTEGAAPNAPAEGRDGGHEWPGRHGNAEGMRDGGPGHDGMQPGDHGDCDEQADGDQADA